MPDVLIVVESQADIRGPLVSAFQQAILSHIPQPQIQVLTLVDVENRDLNQGKLEGNLVLYERRTNLRSSDSSLSRRPLLVGSR